MPNITFSSPLHKDKTVYAVAGSHTMTVLTLARENHIPIDFGCERERPSIPRASGHRGLTTTSMRT